MARGDKHNRFDQGTVLEESPVTNEPLEEGTVLTDPDVPTEVDADVDTPAETDTVAEGSEGETKQPKAKKEPARGELPDGYVTPVGFAHELTKRLQAQGASNKHGLITEANPIPPQQIYSTMRNSTKTPMPFAIANKEQTEGGIVDSKGLHRTAGKLDELFAWWDAKDTRKAERSANATAKAEKKENTPSGEAPVAEAEGMDAASSEVVEEAQ
jgi:hypothetical protein